MTIPTFIALYLTIGFINSVHTMQDFDSDMLELGLPVDPNIKFQAAMLAVLSWPLGVILEIGYFIMDLKDRR